MVKKYLCSILFVVISTVSVFADDWENLRIITIYSDNKEYMLMIYPIEYPNDYFTAKYQKQLKKGIVTDSIVSSHAILYHICNSDTIEVWNRPLVNSQSPVNAIVANDGKSIVTIDDWYSKGYEHTLVIYGEDGELIKDFELKDITPFPLEQYFYSISSIHWGGKVEYLDNDRMKIFFRNKNEEEQTRVFNIKTREFKCIP
ncbi:MAG: hypothetical protein LBR65_02030 [Culturomica sp.]|jgi:hypothetical protein|nr:hypothetical protein [Culturomica sp.]